MSVAIFDSYAFVKRLTAAGMPEAQAEVLADEHRRLVDDRLATKDDIATVKADIAAVKADVRNVETRLEAKIEASSANLKVEILRWLVVTQVALAGFIFAAIKFVK